MHGRRRRLQCFSGTVDSGREGFGDVMSDIERRREADREGNLYLYIALGLVFVFGGLVFALLDPPGTLVVTFGLLIPAAALLGKGFSEMRERRRAVGPPVSKERELLSAIRDNGGSITPAEAAIETSLTVREADWMLSELAGGGHLAVESRSGALFYSLPGRSDQEIEG